MDSFGGKKITTKINGNSGHFSLQKRHEVSFFGTLRMAIWDEFSLPRKREYKCKD